MSISSYNTGALLEKPAARNEHESMPWPRAAWQRCLRPFVFLIVIPLLLFVALYDSNIDGGIDLFHEGESVTPAFESLHGKLPFRDIYLQHGWGVNLLRARLSFSLFGVSVASMRKLWYGDVSGYLVAASWVGVYLLLYSLFRRKIWIVPAFLLLVLADVLINDRHLLPFLSISLLAAGKGRSRMPLFLAGALSAIGFFYSLDTGLYATAIGTAFILLSAVGDRTQSLQSSAEHMASYGGGWVLGALPFIGYLAWHGILGDFLANCYVQLRYQKETWGIASPTIGSLLGPFENTTARNRAFYAFIKWYYPAFVYACVTLALAPALVSRRLRDDHRALLLITLTGIIFFRSAMGRADEGHLMYAIAPFWILNISFLESAFAYVRGKTSRANGGSASTLDRVYRLCYNYFTIGLVVAGLASYFWATCRNGGIVARRAALQAWKEKDLPNYVALNLPQAGGIRVPPEQAEEVLQTVASIQAHSKPDQPIFDFSDQGAYYFLADRLNATSFCQASYAIPRRLQARS